MKPAVRITARTAWGVTLCSLLAVGTSYVFSAHPEKVFVPLGFVIVLVVTAALYGTMTGVLGSIVSALVFARMLYAPIGSLAIDNHAARQSLSWMVLCGVAIPYLFIPGMRQSKQASEQKDEVKQIR